MGLDVNLYAVGDVSDEQLAAANEYLSKRSVTGFQRDDEPLEREDYHDEPRIVWMTASRYYGPDYERGWWPSIHNAIVCLRAALPHCTVHYGSDAWDSGRVVTDEMLDELWQHWLGPKGLAYRDR